ncbi:lipopolysaccharide biosynthesis protein [Shewanella sp. LC6]|uniref:oligosaccharide flippase family protein n=1 Tax=unclassified Shewanella TaxID=196818 RepID=UPI00112C0E38|nr:MULTISPECIES: lipopolysaccharide biosynthesis protein [unclassified Shewanella]QQK59347.1 lipopolysaccharide biosynthesis protein [Shewanella sp. LC6]TPE56494.1 lipopolysaccharide biosynthesis protein [Shewanella sp. LC2]
MTPKKIAAFALGPVAGAALGFIALPIITWFFSQEDIGRLAMLNVVISFSILLFSLGLDQAYVREFHEAKNKPALFKITLLPGLLLLIITLLSLLYFDNIISRWLFEVDSLLLSLLVTVVVLSAFLSRFLSLILRMNEQGLAYSMSQLLPKLLLILIVGGYVVFSVTKNITNLVLANVSAILFTCVIYAWNTRNEWLLGIKENIDYSYLKSLISFGAPLIFGGLAFWGLTATDKILLKELSDFEQLGLYSVAVSFAAAATIFQSVFSTIWAPTVYKWAAAGENFDKIYKVNRYVLLAVIVLFCLAGLFSWVVTFMLPSNYNAVQWILIPCLGFPLLYTLSETTVVGIGVTRRSGFAMLAAVLALVINLLGNWWLIPKLGSAGAAVSTCVSFWFFFLLRTEFAIYLWRPLPRFMLYTYTSLLVIGAVINSIYGEIYAIELKLFWLIMLCSVFVFFKNEVFEIKNWITRSKIK